MHGSVLKTPGDRPEVCCRLKAMYPSLSAYYNFHSEIIPFVFSILFESILIFVFLEHSFTVVILESCFHY